jgi:hypothetical protein
MANALFEAGRNAFAAGTCNWATGKGASGAVQACLISLTATTGIKAITGATTGANAAAVTCTANGFSNGDVVVITGVGGTTTANNLWVVEGQATNAFNLFDYNLGTQGTLTGTYTSGGFAINLGPGASGATWTDFSAALVGTGTAAGVPLTTLSEAQGVVSAATATFPTVSGSVATGIILLATASSAQGTLASSDIPLAWIDGQMVVTCAATLTAGTTLFVERLAGPIANGTVLAFSDGNSATLTSAAAQGARSLAVSSTTITLAARASAPATGSGLPVTPNGGNISVTWDSVVQPGAGALHYGIFKL